MGNGFKELIKLRKEMFYVESEDWLNNTFPSLEWFILVGLLIVPWIIFWRIVDKSKLKELTIYGLFIMIIATYLDAIGNQLTIWGYPKEFFFLLPRAYPFDYSVIPVTYILVYQYFNTWKSFIAAMVVVSLFFSFVGETIAEWLNIYVMLKWNHLYSFPIYIAIAIVFRWVTKKIITISNTQENSN